MSIKTVSEPSGLLRYVIRDGERVLQQEFKPRSFECYTDTDRYGRTVLKTQTFDVTSPPEWRDVPMHDEPVKRRYGILKKDGVSGLLVEIIDDDPAAVVTGGFPRYECVIVGDDIYPEVARRDLYGRAGFNMDRFLGWPWQSSVKELAFDSESEALARGREMVRAFYEVNAVKEQT